MTSDQDRLEARLWALETLVAFLFAAQHTRTSDPAAAARQLRQELIERDHAPSMARLSPELRDLAAQELAAALERVLDLQDQLPRRLVD